MPTLFAPLRALVLSATTFLCACLTAEPTITQQPGVVTTTSGQNATFAVAASGSGGQTYQWRRLGVPMDGAIGTTLTLNNVTMADAGYYDVVVTDGPESTVSQAGRLEVAPPDYGTIFRADPTFTCLIERDGTDISQFALTESGAAYVAGTFTRLGGLRRDGFARINPDLTVDPSFTASANGRVLAIITLPGNGGVLVGGYFTRFGGLPCNGVVRISLDGSTIDPDFAASLGAGSVKMLWPQADGKILALGSGAAFGQGALLRLNADGTLDQTWAPTGSGFGTGINALAVQSDGKMVVCGSLSYNGGSLGRIARFNANGTLDTSFAAGEGFDSAPSAVAIQPDGKIVVLGYFTTYQANPCKGLARLNPDGSLDSTLGVDSGFSGTTNFSAQSLLIQPDGRLVIGGQFASYKGTACTNLVRLSPTGALDPSFAANAAPNAIVTAIAYDAARSQVVVAGQFTGIGASTTSGFARYALDGTVATAGLGGARVAAAVNVTAPAPGGKWVIGGDFNYVNDVPRNRLARIYSDGTLDGTFAVGTGFDNAVVTLAPAGGGRVVAGGRFTAYNGTPRSGIARLNADGSNDATFDIGSGFTTAAVGYLAAMADGRLVVGGDFSQFNGEAAPRLVRLHADGRRDPGFDNRLISQLTWTGMEVDANGRIMVGAWLLGFTDYTMFRRGTFRFNPDGSLDEAFNGGRGASRLDMPATCFVVQPDGRFTAAGYFSNYDGVPRQNLARFNSDGSIDWSFGSGSGLQGTPMAMSVLPDGRILASGFFTSGGLVRTTATGLRDDTFVVFDFSPSSRSSWGNGSRPSYTDDGRILVPGAGASIRDGVWQYGLALFKPDADPRPLITLQPANQSASVGGSASFSVTASGDAVTYQWYKDGVAIAGAKASTLALPAVQPGDFGVYTLVATNSFGSTTSAPALLAIGGVVGASYRLAEYYYPLAQGNSWLHENPTNPEVRLRITIGVVQTINSYSGRTEPVATAVAAMPVQSVHGSYIGGVFTPEDEWTDFLSFEADRLRFWGNDEDHGASQTRAGAGLAFPASLPVGGSAVMEQDLYQDGVWVGGVRAGIRLLGVETVTVPAGTFPGCLHLQIVFACADGVETNEEWWAPGIGMVKHVRAEDTWDDRQLLSFEVNAPMQFAAPPTGASTTMGATTTLAVAANGPAPLTYQWYSGNSGDISAPVVGATDASFTSPVMNAWGRYWVRVASVAGTIDSDTLLIQVADAPMRVADWTALPEVPADQRAPEAIPAADGVCNLMKFALGVPPMESAEAHLPKPATITDSGVPVALALDLAINPHAQGIRYALQVSSDCVTWLEVAYLLEDRGINSDGTQLVRLREAVPPTAIRRFARLKVEVVP